MKIQNQIPPEFYKLFRTKNRDVFMTFLVVLYKENSEAYNSLGLTLEECQQIVAEQLGRLQVSLVAEAEFSLPLNPAGILTRFLDWGWLRREFDEVLNSYVITFPQYSQLYIELFDKLNQEGDSKERESILAIYSTLFTYHSDQEKNNDILKSALRTSSGLGQLLSNMQDGMRHYFDELSSRKNFLGIQEVLVRELNDSASQKYAILTTKDSFYRYKEAVKELISQILNDNDRRRETLTEDARRLQENQSLAARRLARSLELCEEASHLVYQVEREFDFIERKYNKLIEQKATFARRALARIHYLMQEGANDEDTVVHFLNLLAGSDRAEEILTEYSRRISVSSPYRMLQDNSLYNRRDRADAEFTPVQAEQAAEEAALDLESFVPKPLYTGRQLRAFREKNLAGGRFVTTEQTVTNAEDLEMLMMLWQEATAESREDNPVELEGELRGANGFLFTKLIL